jgi:PAS domain S-box-containing protein
MTNDLAANVCDRIVAQMSEAVILADRAGRVMLWNRGAEVLFGHPAAEAMGQSLDIIIPEELRSRHWDGYHRAVSAGRTQLGARALPTKAVRKDGTTIYVELSFAVVLDETGAAVGALAVGRNIRERYLQDKALRRRLAALEHEVATRSEPGGSRVGEGHPAGMGKVV